MNRALWLVSLGSFVDLFDAKQAIALGGKWKFILPPTCFLDNTESCSRISTMPMSVGALGKLKWFYFHLIGL